jgi:hypothetical protein
MTFPLFMSIALFITALIVLPILKLVGIVAFSWWIVTAPLWLLVLGALAFFARLAIGMAMSDK